MTASVEGRFHPRPAIVLGLLVVTVAFLAGLEMGSSTALIVSTSGANDVASPSTRSDWATSFLLAEAQPSTHQLDDVQQTIAAHAATRGGLFERLKRVEDEF